MIDVRFYLIIYFSFPLTFEHTNMSFTFKHACIVSEFIFKLIWKDKNFGNFIIAILNTKSLLLMFAPKTLLVYVSNPKKICRGIKEVKIWCWRTFMKSSCTALKFEHWSCYCRWRAWCVSHRTTDKKEISTVRKRHLQW